MKPTDRPRDVGFVIRKFIEQQRTTRTEDLVSGVPQSYFEYREQVGYLAALTEIEAELTRAVGKNQEDGKEL